MVTMPKVDPELSNCPVWPTECSGLHLGMQFKYNVSMSTSTVGFAVADDDRERLERLVEYFGGGNRSAYPAAALTVMESLARGASA
jgi:hypothetical protein